MPVREIMPATFLRNGEKMTDNLVARDLAVLWHPCSQMKDYESFPPIAIAKATGSYLITQEGKKIFDAISSWWCKSLGHGHPRLKKALVKQLEKFEHVILANTTNSIIVDLSEKLTGLSRGLKKIFYASDGSCAVEIALKLACHARVVQGHTQKKRIGSLKNSYHGETLFALAASDCGIYRFPYEYYLPTFHWIGPLPYVASQRAQEWQDCSQSWLAVAGELEKFKDTLSAIIVEPILQASSGMLVYSQDFLARLGHWCQQNDIYLIVDEIMTGFGRTGKLFAFEYAGIEPDFLCVGKGITSGMLPLSAVLMKNEMYQLFYNDYETGHSFLHSHTHSGNVLAAAVALECLNVMEEENIVEQVQLLESTLQDAMAEVAERTGCLTNLRGIGAMVAADIYLPQEGRLGFEVYKEAVQLGALLRPLGNTIYWLPPLNTALQDIEKLKDITIKAIKNVMNTL
jgi:adenosylmethionine-8-amino-7-oxononanoate aminotransferase